MAAVGSDDGRPTGFWLQVDGCPNRPSWVKVEYTVDDFMLLGQGWKAFARSRHRTQGQYLAFEYDGDVESAWLPPCVVLVINDNLYGLMFVLSYL